jgi:hypothetical protein
MKLKTFVPSLIVAGVLALTVPFIGKAKADPAHHQSSHATVLFSASAAVDGTIRIYYLSASGPGIPELSLDAAEAITQLRNAGFEMIPSQTGWFYTFTR